MRIYIGVCAFKKKYYTSKINCVETQRTFYNIPQEKTVKKWRDEAPEGFIFNIKVFQGLTHTANMPTWRRYSKKLSTKEREKVGNLKLNDLTRRWIDIYAKYAKILDANVLVVQTPARFSPTDENVANAHRFFEYFIKVLDEAGAITWIGWEPRGEWLKDTVALKEIIQEHDKLIHVVDPFIHEPIEIKEVVYFRLHGKPYLNYKYEYTSGDLKQLLNKIHKYKSAERIYVMFNNVYMDKNALDMISMVS